MQESPGVWEAPFHGIGSPCQYKVGTVLESPDFEKSPFMALKVQNHYKVGRVFEGPLEQGCGPLLECPNNNAAPSIQLL